MQSHSTWELNEKHGEGMRPLWYELWTCQHFIEHATKQPIDNSIHNQARVEHLGLF